MDTADVITDVSRTALCQLPHSNWPVGVVVLKRHELAAGAAVTISIENPVSCVNNNQNAFYLVIREK